VGCEPGVLTSWINETNAYSAMFFMYWVGTLVVRILLGGDIIVRNKCKVLYYVESRTCSKRLRIDAELYTLLHRAHLVLTYRHLVVEGYSIHLCFHPDIQRVATAISV
jgi:hypothetical protein